MQRLFQKNWTDFLDVMPIPVMISRCTTEQLVDFSKESVLYINRAFEEILGYGIDDLTSKQEWYERAFPDSAYREWVLQRMVCQTQQAQEKSPECPFSFVELPNRIQCANGKELWFQRSAKHLSLEDSLIRVSFFMPVNQPDEMVLALKEAGKALQLQNSELLEKESRLNQIRSMTKIGTWELDLYNNSVFWSPELYDLYEEDPQTFQPTLDSFWKGVAQDELLRVQQTFYEGLKDGKEKRFVHKRIRKDGSFFYIDIVGKAIFDETNRPVKVIGASMDVSHLIALQQENEDLANLMKLAHQEIYIIDYHSLNYLYANDSALEQLGYSLEELMQITVCDVNPQLTLEQIDLLKSQGALGEKVTNLTLHKRKDGTLYPVKAILQRIRYAGQDAVVIFDTDITELKQAEQEAKDRFQLLQNILNHVPVRIFWKDLEGRYQGGNDLLVRDAGFSSIHELIGKTDMELPWASSHAEQYRTIDFEVMQTGQSVLQREDRIQTAEGERVLSFSTVPLEDEASNVIGVLGSYEDVTEWHEMHNRIRKQEEIMHYQANFDRLTELPNRGLLEDRLNHAIERAEKSGKSLALLFVDMDLFKRINDSYGHNFGDDILRQFAARMKRLVPSDDTLARMGGDEFAVLMESIASINDASAFAQEVLLASQAPFVIDEQPFYITASIGIAMYPKDGETSQELLASADAAVYRAKDEGRNNFQFFTKDMTVCAFEHLAMQTSLKLALEKQEFEVYYQPQMNAQTNQIIGIEALVRWNHPLMGLVSPAKFIPIAEETGMIVELDRITIEQSLKQLKAWYDQGLSPGVLSINLAVKQLQQVDFLDFIHQVLFQTGCQPAWIEMEITESDLMKNLKQMESKLMQLQALGMKVSIDDFGTGYSSLSYLKRLPVSKLKIDQSFIRDMPEDEEDSVITKTIIAMAKSLGLNVIAEGVETQAQKAFLVENDCQQMQGYFYSRPLCINDMQNFLQLQAQASLENEKD